MNIHLQKEGLKMSETVAKSSHNGVVLLLVCWLLGYLGVHRFMVGKVGTGILYLCTLGLLGIGVFIDFIMILVGSFKDKDGNVIKLS